MPQPSKEQFDAAAKKVMETAPAGLSRDEFFKLVDKQLSSVVEPVSAMDMVSGRVGRDSGTEKEPDTWTGGFIKGLRQNFVDPLVGSDVAKHAARPTSAADVAGLLLPSGIGMGSAKEFIPAAKKLYEGAAQGASEREGLKKVPAVIKGMWGATKRTPNQTIANYERDIMSKGHVPPDTTSIPDGGLPMEEMPSATPPVEVETAQDALSRKATAPTGGVQGDRIPYATPTARPSTSGFGKLTGKKTPSLDEVLQRSLEESHGIGPDPAQTSTLAETPMTGGMQKPKVGKRPGGYTTDIPARGEAPKGGVDAVPAEGVTRSPADRRATPSGKVDRITETSQGADQLEELLSALHPDEAIPRVNPEGHGSMSPVEPDLAARAKELRRLKGARDAGAEMFPELSESERTARIRELAPGPSRTPLEAEDRINAATRKAKGDDLPSVLLAMLTGGGLASRQTTSNQGGLQ